MRHGPPAGRSTASTISASPAATTTSPTSAATARRSTRTIIGIPADVGQGLAGQALGGEARGDDDDRVHGLRALERPREPPPSRALLGCAGAGSVPETPAQTRRRIRRRSRGDLRDDERSDREQDLGAGLATALFIIGLSVGLPLAFKKEPPKQPGYAIAVADDSGGAGEAADTPPDWGTVLKTADVSAGEAKTARLQGLPQLRSRRAPTTSAPGSMAWSAASPAATPASPIRRHGRLRRPSSRSGTTSTSTSSSRVRRPTSTAPR